MSGTLSIVSTPIGNLEDISIRAIKTLFSVDIILCEDTRRTGTLLSELQKRFPEYALRVREVQLISYYDEIEQKRLPEVIEKLQSEQSIALVSDNGTPTISDPGFRLVREARKRNIPVISVPGPSAVIAALSISGFPTNQFSFFGFLPERSGPRIKLLEQMKEADRFVTTTHVVYCAPHKLQQTLVDLLTVFNDIEIVVARELTKVHEEVMTGTISEVAPRVTEIKGECVLLF